MKQLTERLRTCPERSRNTIDAAERIEVLLLQREDDKQAMADVLEALERYQVKRQDFDRFHDAIHALRRRLDLERVL